MNNTFKTTQSLKNLTHIGFPAYDDPEDEDILGNTIIWNKVKEFDEQNIEGLINSTIKVECSDIEILLNKEDSTYVHLLINNQHYYCEIMALEEKFLESSNDKGFFDTVYYQFIRGTDIFPIDQQSSKMSYTTKFGVGKTTSDSGKDAFGFKTKWDFLLQSFFNSRGRVADIQLNLNFYPSPLVFAKKHHKNYFFPEHYNLLFTNDEDPVIDEEPDENREN